MEIKSENSKSTEAAQKKSLSSKYLLKIKSSLHSLIYLLEKNVLEPIALNENFKYRATGFDARLSTLDDDGGQITNNTDVKIHDGRVFENRFQMSVFKLLSFFKRLRAKLYISSERRL